MGTTSLHSALASLSLVVVVGVLRRIRGFGADVADRRDAIATALLRGDLDAQFGPFSDRDAFWLAVSDAIAPFIDDACKEAVIGRADVPGQFCICSLLPGPHLTTYCAVVEAAELRGRVAEREKFGLPTATTCETDCGRWGVCAVTAEDGDRLWLCQDCHDQMLHHTSYAAGRVAEREQIRAGIEALAGRADAEEGRDYFEFTDVSPDGKPIEVRALAVDTVLALIDAREGEADG